MGREGGEGGQEDRLNPTTGPSLGGQERDAEDREDAIAERSDQQPGDWGPCRVTRDEITASFMAQLSLEDPNGIIFGQAG